MLLNDKIAQLNIWEFFNAYAHNNWKMKTNLLTKE